MKNILDHSPALLDSRLITAICEPPMPAQSRGQIHLYHFPLAQYPEPCPYLVPVARRGTISGLGCGLRHPGSHFCALPGNDPLSPELRRARTTGSYGATCVFVAILRLRDNRHTKPSRSASPPARSAIPMGLWFFGRRTS